MKKRNIYAGLMLLMGTFASCSKDYLETSPTDKVDNALIFTTTANAEVAMNGIYRYMFERTTAVSSSQQNKPGVGGILIGTEFMADDLNISSSNWYSSVEGGWLNARNDNHVANTFAYRTLYRIIGNANLIIDGIDGAVGTAEDKLRIKTEALAVRAYAYSMLVQCYAIRYDATSKPNRQPGVPLMLNAADAKKPRATVEEVYASIVSDLDQAIANNVDERLNKSHINSTVAKALRARVALTMQDYPTAIKYSKEVIDSKAYPLMDSATYRTGFNDATKITEFMWSTMPTVDQGDTFGSFFAQLAYNANTSFMRANPKRINAALYAFISPSDVRKTMWEPNPDAKNFPLPASTFTREPYMSRKFAVKAVGGPSLGDMPYVRTSEMYLILAEAYAQTGDFANAQDVLFQLNKVRDAKAVKSVNTGQALLSEIWKYRRVELWGEGFRWFDLKRLNQPLDRTVVPNFVSSSVPQGLVSVPAGDKMWQFFIPILEMQANPSLSGQQNP